MTISTAPWTPGNAVSAGNAASGVPTPTAVPGAVVSAGNAQRANAISTAVVRALAGIEKLLGTADCKSSVGDNGGMQLRFTYQGVEYCFYAQTANKADTFGISKDWTTQKEIKLGERGYTLCVGADGGVAYMQEKTVAVEYAVTAEKGATEATLTEVANVLFPEK